MNARSLATCIYEKGPQTLTDTISKVEKPNAVQQLTAMINPPSTVNMMSHMKKITVSSARNKDI